LAYHLRQQLHPLAVAASVAQCAAWVHDGTRLVVAPTHMLEPDVLW
jgi:hypothetical protein